MVIEHRSSLKERVLKAGAWTTGGFAVSQVIRLGSNLILTRLLFPESFGLMSIVYVLMTGLALFSDLGLDQNVIQNRRGDEADFLNTVWSVKILRGILLCMSIIFIATMLPHAVGIDWIPAGSVYTDPMLPSVLLAFSVAPLLQGFTSTNIALAQRNVQVKPCIQVELISQIVALVVMLVLAWLYHTVWALVAGAIVSVLVQCVMSHVWLPGPGNKLHWNQDCFKEIFGFGKWVFLLSIVGFISTSGDRVMLGGLLDTATLGVYAIAFLIFSSLQTLYRVVLARVVFPSFSELAGESSMRIGEVSSKFQLVSDVFLFGCAGFLFATGDSIINLLYDERYHDAGSMLSILGLGLIGMRHMVVEQWWLTNATMRLLFLSTMLRLIVLFVGISWGFTLMGLQGALVGIVMSYFAGWPVALYYRFQHSLIEWKYEFIGVLVFASVVLLESGISWIWKSSL